MTKIITVNDNQETVTLYIGQASAGTGTVTSVAVSGSDGIEVNSGSPITSNGTIALGLNKTNTLAFLNVEDGATANTKANIETDVLFPMGLALGDETTDLTTGTAVSFQMPNFATTLTGVSVNVVTAPTGSGLTFDVNEGGTSVLSTKITIDVSTFSSEVAATAPVISDSSIAANAIITVDIDAVGSTIAGAGAKIWLYVKKA